MHAKQNPRAINHRVENEEKKEDARSFECFFGFARFSYDEHDGQYNAYEQRARLKKSNRSVIFWSSLEKRTVTDQ